MNVMQEQSEKLFTTSEITLATGLPRGTITNRAKTLGFDRTGCGYTTAQVLAMVTMPMQIHRRSEERATELRESLNEMLAQLDLPMEIVQQPNGHYEVEYWRAGKKAIGNAGGRRKAE